MPSEVPGGFGATLQGACYGAIPGILVGSVVGRPYEIYGVIPGVVIGCLVGALFGGILGRELYGLEKAGKPTTRRDDGVRDRELDD